MLLDANLMLIVMLINEQPTHNGANVRTGLATMHCAGLQPEKGLVARAVCVLLTRFRVLYGDFRVICRSVGC